ncbi:MAG: cache domain-containing protein [Treponema sp.]|nr:cache domain-containing protein [Treponema sp.]
MAKKELDRFDTKAKRDMKLSTKLIGLIGGFILLAAVLVATISLSVFDSKLIKNTQKELTYTEHGAANVMADWVSTLALTANILTDSPYILQSTSHQDSAGTRAYLEKKKEGNDDLDLLAVIDAYGIVVASNMPELGEGKNLNALSCVYGALKGKPTTTFEAIGSLEFAALAACPVKEGGKVTGCVLAGYDLTNGYFAELMQDGYNVECTIFRDATRVDSTLPDVKGTRLDNEDIINSVLHEGKSFEGKNIIKGKEYYSTYQPLVNGDGSIAGMLFIAKDVEMVKSIKNTTLAIVIPITAALIAFLLICSYTFIHWLMWRIYNVTNFLKELETGDADLTKRCKLFIRDEIGDLIIHFDLFLDKLQQIMKDVQGSKARLTESGDEMSRSAEDTASAISQIIVNIDDISAQITSQGGSVGQTAVAVDDISQNIQSMDDLIESQSSGVSEASAAVEQMIGNISSVNQSVDKMADSFQVLSADAQSGFDKQQAVNEKVRQIEDQSKMLQEANQAISSIASQTNLLAMNAAIEAAHAGEAGKGFSVVADEIRKLSETSSGQSKTIGEQLKKIKDSITEVVSASQESSEAFAAVSSKIKETDALVMQIKAAMQEQNEGSKQIGGALKNMNDSTVEVHKASKEMSARSAKIKAEMGSLQEVTSSMKRSMDQMSAGAQRISETGSVLGSISGRMHGAIDKIGSQIDLFKV